MKLKMRDEDRRALDLLLDRAATAAGKAAGTPLYAAASDPLRERVSKVEKVLNLLDAMPAEEPPKDLLSRTLRRIEQSTGRAVLTGREVGPTLFSQGPVA